jgi:hypothetical protein
MESIVKKSLDVISHSGTLEVLAKGRTAASRFICVSQPTRGARRARPAPPIRYDQRRSAKMFFAGGYPAMITVPHQ